MIKRILITLLICISLVGLGYEVATHQYTNSWTWNWPTWNWGSSGHSTVSGSIDFYSWSCSQLQSEINNLVNSGDLADTNYAIALEHIYEEKGCHP